VALEGVIAVKRVFLFSSQSLFSEGIESLLRRELGLEIVGRETDVGRAIECIKEFQPDVVIMDSSDPQDDFMTAVMHILREDLEIKLIGLNLHNNTLSIYRGQQRLVRELKDLEEAIKVLEGRA
jgi:DNA-binding NarL/FixJ family response regulator